MITIPLSLETIRVLPHICLKDVLGIIQNSQIALWLASLNPTKEIFSPCFGSTPRGSTGLGMQVCTYRISIPITAITQALNPRNEEDTTCARKTVPRRGQCLFFPPKKKEEEKKRVLNFSAAKDLFAQTGKIQQRSKEVPLFPFSRLPCFLDFTFQSPFNTSWDTWDFILLPARQMSRCA